MEFKISLLCQRLHLIVQYLATAVTLLLFYGTPTAPAQTPEQIAKTKAATVSLEMKDNTGKIISIGSGFFVRPNLIATNYHIIVGTVSGIAKIKVGRLENIIFHSLSLGISHFSLDG